MKQKNIVQEILGKKQRVKLQEKAREEQELEGKDQKVSRNNINSTCNHNNCTFNISRNIYCNINRKKWIIRKNRGSCR